MRKLGVYARRVANKTSRSESEVAGDRTCVALHRRIVVARRSTGSLLQLLALGGFAAAKTVINCFYLATLPPQGSARPVALHPDRLF